MFSLSAVGFGQTATLSGTVLNALGGEPLGLVEISIAGKTVTTDGSGMFRLADLPPGEHALRASTVGYRIQTERLTLGADEETTVRIILSPDTFRRTDKIEIESGPFDIKPHDSPAQLTLSGTEMRNLASVLIDDPLRSVQSLPGVSSNDDTYAQFTLRAAGYHRIGLYVDDVLLHSPFHTVPGVTDGASVTAINSDMLEAVGLTAQNYPSRFGDRTGGVIDIHTREGSRREPSFRLTTGILATTALAEGPLASRRGAWIASVRKSYLNYVLRRITDNEPEVFDFTDVQGKASYDVTPRHTLSLSALMGHSAFSRYPERARLGPLSLLASDYDVTTSNLGWRWVAGESLVLTSRVAYLREKTRSINRDDAPILQQYYGEWVGSQSAQWTWGPNASFEAGGNVRRIRDAGFVNAFVNNPVRMLRREDFRATALRTGGFGQQTWTWRSFRVSGGGRWDWHDVNGVHAVSPNLSVLFPVAPRTALQLAAASYVQYPDTSILFSNLGSLTLAPERSNHYTAALDHQLSATMRLRLEAFDREDRDLLVRPFDEPRLVDNRVIAGDVNARYRNAVRASARGAQVMLQRRSANGLAGWIAYTLAYAKDRSDVEALRYWSDLDQRHTMNLYASYRWRAKVNLSGRYIYGSGFPVPGFLTQRGTQYFLSPTRNMERLPSYQRVDVRVAKSFEAKKARATLFAEVTNLANRDNLRFLGTNGYNNSTRQAFVNRDTMMPMLPAVGLQIEFSR